MDTPHMPTGPVANIHTAACITLMPRSSFPDGQRLKDAEGTAHWSREKIIKQIERSNDCPIAVKTRIVAV